MEGSEDRGVYGTDLRTGEGAIFVYQELSNWLFVAQLETLEVDDWASKDQSTRTPTAIYRFVLPAASRRRKRRLVCLVSH
jgi:hypothetical protein